MSTPERATTPNDEGPSPRDLTSFLGSKKVLIVDDDADIRTVVQMMLSHCKVESISAATVDEAMELIAEQDEDIGLVLLDLSIPNASPTPPLPRIKQQCPSLPVIVMTGLPREAVRIDPTFADSVGYLQKPFVPPALYEAMGRRRAVRRDSGGRGRSVRRDSGESLQTG